MSDKTEQAELSGVRIIVAEDDAAVRRMIRRRLEQGGCTQVVECASAKEALREIRAAPPDVIVLDGHLGDLTGLQVLRILKHDPCTQVLPVLMISGTVEDAGEKTEARELGAVEFLEKPVPWTQLREALFVALARAPRARTQPFDGTPLGNIIVADDDPEWLGLIRTWLEAAGYRVLPTAEGGKVVEMAGRLKPDCIVLDFHLRDTSAVNVCFNLQREDATKKIPVMVLTADKEQELVALNGGADQFVAKSGNADEFLAKLHVCLRRKALDADTLERGDLRLDRRESKLYRNGKPVCGLSRDEFLFLDALVEASPRCLEREEIVRRIWPGEEIHPLTIDKLVWRLRKKLGPELGARVCTVKNQGWIYRGPQPPDPHPSV